MYRALACVKHALLVLWFHIFVLWFYSEVVIKFDGYLSLW
jgi:hypothetical protein